ASEKPTAFSLPSNQGKEKHTAGTQEAQRTKTSLRTEALGMEHVPEPGLLRRCNRYGRVLVAAKIRLN
ncbi:MAG: hypothetical protein WA894_15345, partial [Candidatus Acidiferrum sp.]